MDIEGDIKPEHSHGLLWVFGVAGMGEGKGGREEGGPGKQAGKTGVIVWSFWWVFGGHDSWR